MNGITDIVATVTVPKPEYESLVRESERLDILKSFIKKGKYITTDDIKAILGDEEREGEQNESV